MLAMFLGGGELLLIPLVLFFLLFGVLCFAFWIWMLVDCIQNERISANEKVAWVVAIALTHWLGALIYFFAARTRRGTIAAPPLA